MLTILGLLVFAIASPATAVSFTMELDQPSYEVGDLVHLRVVGDAEDAGWNHVIFARLAFDSSVRLVLSTATLPVSDGIPWTMRSLCNDGRIEGGYGTPYRFTDVWITDPPSKYRSYTIDGPVTAHVYLYATQPGDFTLRWDPNHPIYANFFGESLLSHTATVHVVPEPGTLALVVVGLALLGRLWNRRQRFGRCR